MGHGAKEKKLKAESSKIGKVYLPFLPNQLINELTNQPINQSRFNHGTGLNALNDSNELNG